MEVIFSFQYLSYFYLARCCYPAAFFFLYNCYALVASFIYKIFCLWLFDRFFIYLASSSFTKYMALNMFCISLWRDYRKDAFRILKLSALSISPEVSFIFFYVINFLRIFESCSRLSSFGSLTLYGSCSSLFLTAPFEAGSSTAKSCSSLPQCHPVPFWVTLAF